ncbi:MAG TPA: uroporphyrinogen decarboxylase family protein [Chloroflexota bacterium]|nr:uroporphyrinogen decarboxylase family protein [Chloroflexota bacterium]
MNNRERIALTLAHKEPDRVPVHDTVWTATVDRWRGEGFPDDVTPAERFDYAIAGFGADLSPRFPVRVLERTEEYVLETTADGGVRRNHRDRSTTPEVIECAIHSREDWERIRPRLEASVTRVNWVTLHQEIARQRAEGRFVTFNAAVGYDRFQSLVRSEDLLMAIAEDPEWVREMLLTHAQLVVEQAKLIFEQGYRFDGAFLYCDLGYRNASLFSPASYRKVQFESDRLLYDFFHRHDMPVILHSCGRVTALIPHLIEAGLDCLQPLEVKAGMDLGELKREFGRDLAFMGGIDVRCMSDPDPCAIEDEIRSKFAAGMPGGGFIYHSDHSIPNVVSLAQYERVMDLVRRYGVYA